MREPEHGRTQSRRTHKRSAIALRYKAGDRPPQPQRTFQNTWHARCEDDWLRAFYMFSFSEAPPPTVIIRVQDCHRVCTAVRVRALTLSIMPSGEKTCHL